MWSPWLFKLAFLIFSSADFDVKQIYNFYCYHNSVWGPLNYTYVYEELCKIGKKIRKILTNVIEDIFSTKNIKISWEGIKMLVTYIRNWISHFFTPSPQSFLLFSTSVENLSIICYFVPSISNLKSLHLVMFLQCSYSKGKVPKLLPHNQLFT